MNEENVIIEENVIAEEKKPAVEFVTVTEKGTKLKYPQLPKVSNPVVFRTVLPLAEGKHRAKSTGVTMFQISKNGRNLIFLTVVVDGYGEQQIMVSNEELLTFAPTNTEMIIDCAEPKDGYSSVKSISIA